MALGTTRGRCYCHQRAAIARFFFSDFEAKNRADAFGAMEQVTLKRFLIVEVGVADHGLDVGLSRRIMDFHNLCGASAK